MMTDAKIPSKSVKSVNICIETIFFEQIWTDTLALKYEERSWMFATYGAFEILLDDK